MQDLPDTSAGNALATLVAYVVNMLDAGMREDYEERAAIMEYDANLSRGHAEWLALLDVLGRYPDAVITRPRNQ